MASMLLCTLFAWALLAQTAYSQYPVPTPPGGRMAVHGWLILPVDQPVPADNEPETPVPAYFVHHTPEFWTDSPHNFQIILYGNMVPISTVNNVTQVIPIPYPPSVSELQDEFTITPPGSFSLNDLLTGRITTLFGAVYNGSFDTPYERYAIALASLEVVDLTTAVYLNYSTAVPALPNLQYYQYPRSLNASYPDGYVHIYMSHKIQAAPDFDQVIHSAVLPPYCYVEGSGCSKDALLMTPGNVWIIPNSTNDVDHRLMPGAVEMAVMTTEECSMTCKLIVLEQIHCVVGPGFSANC